MNHLFQYLLQSSASLAALYMVYWLFLRRETFFTVNRLYLVSAALLSLLMPLFRFSLYDIGPARSVVIYLDPVIITPDKIGQVAAQYGTGIQTIAVVYFTGVIIFLARFIFQLIQLALVVRRHDVSRQEGIRLVFIDHSCSPFSFFHYVFVNRRLDQDPGISTIIDHEQVHVRQRHSVDLVLVELLVAFQWFNPFAWFIAQAIKTNHEFLADEGVLLNGLNKREYQELLLTRATGIRVVSIANNFNISLLKKRIIMMTKSRSTAWAKGKIFFALPAFLAVLFLFSTSSFGRIITQTSSITGNSGPDKPALVKAVSNTPEQPQTQTENKEKQKQQVKYVSPVVLSDSKTSKGEPCYTVVEKQPSYVGGQDAMMKFLVENITYPKEALEKGVTGTVYTTFVVKADGAVADVKILRGIGSGCDEEALRVVKMMPKWNPGSDKGKALNVQFNLPIKFKLDKEGDKGKKK